MNFDDEENEPRKKLKVISVEKTLQGEGLFTGTPSIFVRLAGCSVQCSFCDEDYLELGATKYGHEALVDLIGEKLDGDIIPLVVITGGEPLEQEIGWLVGRLLFLGFRVQIETSGAARPDKTLTRILESRSTMLHLTCSPKRGRINSVVYQYAKSFKYVVGAAVEINDESGTPLGLALHRPGAIVCLQPMDLCDYGHNMAALERCISLVKRYGFKLSVQLHKMIGIP